MAKKKHSYKVRYHQILAEYENGHCSHAREIVAPIYADFADRLKDVLMGEKP